MPEAGETDREEEEVAGHGGLTPLREDRLPVPQGNPQDATRRVLRIRNLVSACAVVACLSAAGAPAAMADGAIAVDCDAMTDPVQTDCTGPASYATGTEFDVKVRVTALPTGGSETGYTGFQTKLTWTDAILGYLPKAQAEEEIKWDDSFLPLRSPSTGAGAPPLAHGDVSALFAPPPFPVSEYKKTIVQLRFRCKATGTSPIHLVAWGAGTDPLGTLFVLPPDASSNADATLADASVRCSSSVPDTRIDSGPSGATTSTSAAFAFSSVPSGATFQCKLDGSGWSACSSRKTYRGLSRGSHNFQVRARNADGTDPTPATRSFTVTRGLRILTRSTRATRNWVVKVRLRCVGDERCRGRLTLRTRGKVRTAAKRRKLTLGRRSFSIPAGKKRTVKVKLRRAARRVLRRARKRRLRARAIATPKAGEVVFETTRRKVTIKAPKRRR